MADFPLHDRSFEGRSTRVRPSDRRRASMLLILIVGSCFSVLHAQVPPDPHPTGTPDTAVTIRLSAPRAEGPALNADPARALARESARLLFGTVRFSAEITGAFAEVRFQLDGRTVVQRRTEPWSADLFVGRLPTERTVRASAHDARGALLASSDLVINQRPNAFQASFLEPQSGAQPNPEGKLRVRLAVSTPPESQLAAVDLFLGEELIQTFTDPPLETVLPKERLVGLVYLRALATLEDGNTTEAVVFANALALVDSLDVHYVQLYVSARERRSRQPVVDLERSDFMITEDGRPQTILRFGRVSDLALNLAVLLDSSASMAPRLEISRLAARALFSDTMSNRDRATLVTFNDRPTLEVELTGDTRALDQALERTRASRGTALYDSLVFGLHQLSGVRGQRALLILSDGKDESSKLRFEDALEFAQRSGVPIFVVGLGYPERSGRARSELQELADVTGGAAFFLDQVSAIVSAYREIATDLRSRYLLTYQSDQSDHSVQSGRSAQSGASRRRTSSGRFRQVEVGVSRRNVIVSAPEGYYP